LLFSFVSIECDHYHLPTKDEWNPISAPQCMYIVHLSPVIPCIGHNKPAVQCVLLKNFGIQIWIQNLDPAEVYLIVACPKAYRFQI